MKIFDFDITKGLYSFEFEQLKTEQHAHPVMEIICASQDTFILETPSQKYTGLTFAIIEPNVPHQVIAGQCKVLMIETYNVVLNEFLLEKQIVFKNSVFSKKELKEKEHLFSEIKQFATKNDLKSPADDRIKDCLEYLQENDIAYQNLITSLTSKAFLSESRLSHLFKEHIGVSIKKYLVWNKLRRAIDLYLEGNTNLTGASLQSGFFDQAHLSKSFKEMLGVTPSGPYNSRTLQA